MDTQPFDIDLDTVARAGTGSFISNVVEGSLGDYEPDDAFDLIEMATSSPAPFMEMAGTPDVDMDAIRGNMASEYYAARIAAIGEVIADSEEGAVDAASRDADETAFTYAGLGPEDIARMNMEEADGADSAVRSAARARYYLG